MNMLGSQKYLALFVAQIAQYIFYDESNGKYVCGMKYGDDTFPNVKPRRLLYSSDTAHSPGHYDLLVNQHIISTTRTVISTAMNPQSFFDTWRDLCKTCSL